MASIPSNFGAMYLGKCVVLDTNNKRAVKMATRSILIENKKQSTSPSTINDSFEVEIELKTNWIKVKKISGNTGNHNHRKEQLVLNIFQDKIASCFVLRENPQIISLVIMSEDFIADAHVFCMNNEESAQNLMNRLMNVFQIGD